MYGVQNLMNNYDLIWPWIFIIHLLNNGTTVEIDTRWTSNKSRDQSVSYEVIYKMTLSATHFAYFSILYPYQ